jgi:hypothetical protein
MKYLSLIGLFLVFQQIALAQIAYPVKPEDAKQIIARKLLVITTEPDPKRIAKLKKKGEDKEVAEIEQLHTAFNEALKETISKRWTIHSSVLYKTMDEFWEMDKKVLKEYVVMVFYSVAHGSGDEYLHLATIQQASGKKKRAINEFNELFPLVAFVAAEKLTIPVNPDRDLYSRRLPEVCPGPLSVFLTLQLINKHILESAKLEKKISEKDEQMAIANNHKTLKEYTLFIGEEWKEVDLSTAKIKAIYPYPAQVLNQSALLDKLRSDEKQIAVHFVWPEVTIQSGGSSFPSAYTEYYHFILDIQSGNVLAISKKTSSPSLTEKALKEWAVEE